MKRFYLYVLFLALSFLGNNAVLAVSPNKIPVPEEKFGVYVKTGLNVKECQGKSEGDIVVKLKIPATVNPKALNPDGTLKNADALIASGIIGAAVNIAFPAYDIDDKTHMPGVNPERDEVYFNGKYVLKLEGFNNEWTYHTFSVPTREVRFSAAGNEHENEFRVKIDVNNNIEAWCMSLDWIAVEVDAAYPYVLAHGVFAQADTWDEKDARGVLTVLDEKGVVYTRFSTPDKSGSVEENAKYLKTQIAAFLKPMKADKVNIIAHSKGALDSQQLATISRPEFEILSLTAINSPLHGSVVADMQMLSRKMAEIYQAQPDAVDPNGYVKQFLGHRLAAYFNAVFKAGPQEPALQDLQTLTSERVNDNGGRNNVPNFFTLAADVGADCKRDPTPEELKEMFPGYPVVDKVVYESLATGYNVVCNVERVEFSKESQFIHKPSDNIYMKDEIMMTYGVTAASQPQPNDGVASVKSSHPGWGTPLATRTDVNHSEAKNRENVELSLEHTLRLR